MSEIIAEFDTVEVTQDLPEQMLAQGTRAKVTEIFTAYMIEPVDEDGSSLGQSEVVRATDIRLVEKFNASPVTQDEETEEEGAALDALIASKAQGVNQ